MIEANSFFDLQGRRQARLNREQGSTRTAVSAAAVSSMAVAWKETRTKAEDAVVTKNGNNDAKLAGNSEAVRPNSVDKNVVKQQVTHVKKQPIIDAQSPVLKSRRAADKSHAKSDENKNKITSQTKRNVDHQHAHNHEHGIWNKIPLTQGLRIGKALGIGAVGMGTVVTVVKGLLGGMQSDVVYDPPNRVSGRLQRDTDWMSKVEWIDSESL